MYNNIAPNEVIGKSATRSYVLTGPPSSQNIVGSSSIGVDIDIMTYVIKIMTGR